MSVGVRPCGEFARGYPEDERVLKTRFVRASMAAFIGLLFVLPFIAGGYVIAIVSGILIAVVGATGLNILTGFRKELVPTFATHTHIRGVSAVVSQEEKKQLQLGAAESIKRVRARKRDDEIDWTGEKAQSVYEIRDFIEFKTTWHPIGA